MKMKDFGVGSEVWDIDIRYHVRTTVEMVPKCGMQDERRCWNMLSVRAYGQVYVRIGLGKKRNIVSCNFKRTDILSRPYA